MRNQCSIMENKTIIVTGASGNLGAEIVKSLLQKGFSVVMACRNLKKGKAVRAEILKELSEKEAFVLLEQLDLSSFESIRNFVETISKKNIRPIGLINNAGTMNRRFSLTSEGFESTIGVNYVGVFMLTNLLIPLLREGAGITTVVSMTASSKLVTRDFFISTPENFKQIRNYALSKSALMLYTASLAEKYKGQFHVNAADPGIVDTDIIRLHRWFDPLADLLFRPLIKSPRRGAIPLVNALLSKETGKVFLRKRHKNISVKFMQHPLKEWFWEETERQIDAQFPL